MGPLDWISAHPTADAGSKTDLVGELSRQILAAKAPASIREEPAAVELALGCLRRSLAVHCEGRDPRRLDVFTYEATESGPGVLWRAGLSQTLTDGRLRHLFSRAGVNLRAGQLIVLTSEAILALHEPEGEVGSSSPPLFPKVPR